MSRITSSHRKIVLAELRRRHAAIMIAIADFERLLAASREYRQPRKIMEADSNPLTEAGGTKDSITYTAQSSRSHSAG